MKARNILFIAFAVMACVLSATAQKVIVAGKKQVYTRPKPSIDFKKTFSIRRPIVTASTPALSKAITALLDPAKVLDIDIKEEMGEYQWLSEADYEVVYNDRGMLTVKLWMEGSAAYPDGVTKYSVIDTAKGVRVSPADVFTDLEGLAKLLKKKQDAAVAEQIKVIKADPDLGGDEDPKQLFENTNFEVKDREWFAADMAGVAFFYDYGFPHVIQALEPDSELRLSWSEIKPFIRKEGLLARFVP
jgi:hypothetical protein